MCFIKIKSRELIQDLWNWRNSVDGNNFETINTAQELKRGMSTSTLSFVSNINNNSNPTTKSNHNHTSSDPSTS